MALIVQGQYGGGLRPVGPMARAQLPSELGNGQVPPATPFAPRCMSAAKEEAAVAAGPAAVEVRQRPGWQLQEHLLSWQQSLQARHD